MKDFFKKVITTFEAAKNKQLFTDQNISPVGYIDLYAGQDQYEENFELFSQPALFVDWDIDYGGDTPLVTVNLYCCYEQLRDTSNISANRDLALGFLDFVATINTIAQTIESEDTGKLELASEGFNKMDSIVDIYLFTYTCSGKQTKNPQQYVEGDYDTLDLQANLVQKLEFD